jgi:HEAT repeat protein
MALTWYCWRCYAKLAGAPSERCRQCGGSAQAPASATYTDKLLWALNHPPMERRVVAAAALAEQQEARALMPLKAMAANPDPYLALAAVRALSHFPEADVMATLRGVARHGPAPARRAARRIIEEREHADRRAPRARP